MNEPMSEAPSRPEEQLEAIRAMLSAGHRAILLEPHTFVLWGIAITLWSFAERALFSEAHFPVLWQRGAFQVAFVTICMTLTAALDFRLTRRVRRRRDESYPFIQRQAGKFTILLAILGQAAAFGGWFHPWGFVTCVMWIVILGLILFVHGLFSEQLLEWAGVAVTVLGVAAVPLHLPFEATRWLLLATCGVGLPLLGLLLRTVGKLALPLRVICLAAWISAIALAAFIANRVAEG